jgi:urea carboxylase
VKQEIENLLERVKSEAKPTYTSGGGSDLVVYYGDQQVDRFTFLIIRMMREVLVKNLREAKIPGITEIQGFGNTLHVMFDPSRIRFEDLITEVKKIEEKTEDPETWSADVRLFEIPVWFNDPWSMECYLALRDKHQIKDGSRSNFEYVAQLNGWSNEEFIEKVCTPLYRGGRDSLVWSVHSGQMLEREEKNIPRISNWPQSRPWTPPRTVGIGAGSLVIYPYLVGGGFQMIGSTPVPVSAIELPPEERKTAKILEALKEMDSLMGPRDLMRVVSIGKEAYEEIRAKVVEGSYEYKVKPVRWETTRWLEDPEGYVRTFTF